MKKIMFNDRFLLTEAVLQGRKTQTRRIIKPKKNNFFLDMLSDENYMKHTGTLSYDDEFGEFRIDDAYAAYTYKPLYKVGEVVAVAQRYSVVLHEYLTNNDHPKLYQSFIQLYLNESICPLLKRSKGWRNKMFIEPDLMPHQVLITDVRVQRLQEITDEECVLEGIQKYDKIGDIQRYITPDRGLVSDDVKHCYSWMIDKISGKGTWEMNPFVFAYSFKLEK